MKSPPISRLLMFTALLSLAVVVASFIDRLVLIDLTPRSNPWAQPGTQLFLAHMNTSGEVLFACTVRDPRVDTITRTTDFMHILKTTRRGDVLVGASNLSRAFLARFEAHSCRLRRSFGIDGVWEATPQVGPFVNDVVIDERENLVVAGSKDDAILVARLMPGGATLDQTFGVNGAVVTDLESLSEHARVAKIDREGRVVVAGQSNANVMIARYLRSGGLDRTFSSGGLFKYDFSGLRFNLELQH